MFLLDQRGAAWGGLESSCAVALANRCTEIPFNLFMECRKSVHEGIASAARYQKHVMDPSLRGPYNHP
jgi:hypothetical protein